MSHVSLPKALQDAARLSGSLFVDALWSLEAWVIRFDCDLYLRVWVERREIQWSLQSSSVVVIDEGLQPAGSAPITLDWQSTIGLCKMDCTALIVKRRGARFKNLFVNQFGLFIYLHGHLILQLSPAEQVADGRVIIYAWEDD